MKEILKQRTVYYSRPESPSTDVLSPLFKRYDAHLDARLQKRDNDLMQFEHSYRKAVDSIPQGSFKLRMPAGRKEDVKKMFKCTSEQGPRVQSPQKIQLFPKTYFERKMNNIVEQREEFEQKTLEKIVRNDQKHQELKKKKQVSVLQSMK